MRVTREAPSAGGLQPVSLGPGEGAEGAVGSHRRTDLQLLTTAAFCPVGAWGHSDLLGGSSQNLAGWAGPRGAFCTVLRANDSV